MPIGTQSNRISVSTIPGSLRLHHIATVSTGPVNLVFDKLACQGALWLIAACSPSR